MLWSTCATRSSQLTTFPQDTHTSGWNLWELVEPEIDYVILHLNGWEGYQQSQIREVVVLAWLVPDTNSGHARMSFVTEGKVNLHFSIDNGLPAGAMKVGTCVLAVVLCGF